MLCCVQHSYDQLLQLYWDCWCRLCFDLFVHFFRGFSYVGQLALWLVCSLYILLFTVSLVVGTSAVDFLEAPYPE